MRMKLIFLSAFIVSGLSAAPAAKKKPNTPDVAKEQTPKKVTATDLNATQAGPPKIAEGPGRYYLEVFGGYGFTYPGLLSTPVSGATSAYTGDPRGGLLFAWHLS